MSEPANRLDGLSPEKRALLLARIKEKAKAAAQEAGISPRADRSSYPLSFAQQRLWILSQLEPDSPFYNITLTLRLSGALDVPALAQSLNEVVRRHEVLRARFITEHGNPIQVIASGFELLQARETLASAGADRSSVEAEAQRIAREEAGRPFDLSRGPLIRARLLRLAEDEHLLILTMHHIVTDAWSTGVLVREIGLLYDSYHNPAAAARELAPLPLQYADYAQWQRDQFQGTRLDSELAYWQEQLRDAAPVLELPTDRPRPAVQTVKGAVVPFAIPDTLGTALRDLARQESATLFQVLLAAYQVLLFRYTGQTDICVGTPVAGRTRPELESLIGFFVNTLVMRGRLDGEPSFREFLTRVRASTLDAQAHQDLPFDMLVDALQPQRNLSFTPIFQVMFALEQRASSALHLPDVTIEAIETHSGTSKFDLTLFMTEDETGLHGAIEYNTDLWQQTSVTRMADHFVCLLAAIVADPTCSVAELSILPEAERRRVVEEWNATATSYPRGKTLGKLFEEQVARSPNAIAVTYGGRSLSFADLNSRANRLAACLQSLGVGPETLVGFYLERSIDLVVAMLGIVKAGGAYLPLDVDYPADRLAFMLKDGRAPVLLTQASLMEQAPPTDATVLQMDADWPRIAQFSDANPVTDVRPGNLAYVIYTSGSTGIPKGVSIPQQAIARLVFNTNYIELGPSDRIAQASNASFDAATFEIWGALLRGARLIGVSKDIALSAHLFTDFLRQEGITTLFLTTALFNYIAAEAPDGFATLSHLLFGGEAVDPRWVRQVLRHGPPRRLLHVYGPTESTTFASWHPVTEVSEDARTVPIGRPLSNTTIYVLDHKFNPVPIGVAGELCIGGDGLAVSYLHRPELTAEKFVPNPFADETREQGDKETGRGDRPISPSPHLPRRARLYRTGDLVRFLEDGAIEFVGRIDYQVKIRGFRIELGEIETILARHPALAQVFVMVRGDASSERHVVAYLVPQHGATPSVSELRSFLRERLPDYMVPAAFVFMDALPLNPNGKVDRKALPAPDQARPETDKEYVAPRTPIERFLAQKWQEVLGIERIGVHDNFFELGGNSLQAAVLTNRMQEELGAAAHVRAVFMAPTIADLAMYLEEYYPDAIAGIVGITPAANGTAQAAGYTFQQKAAVPAQVDASTLAQFRALIPTLPPRGAPADAETAAPNPPAVFVLSPPRSGSTLLRVMLAGNPRLFAPPELDLLSFNTLAERHAAFSGKYEFWLEGPLKAIMALRNCSIEEATALMAEYEAQGWTTKQFYRAMQAWIAASAPAGGRLLVDKTPVYPLDPAILARMEQDFSDARYIHLMRHPFATVYSFMEARLEEIFFRHEHPFSIRALAELVYTVSHQNILGFLARIPAERQHRVWFEELVSHPEPVMQGICEFLGIDFHPAMLEPYQGDRMTSGIRPGQQMVGDFKFYLRNRIDAKAADRWKRFKKDDVLSDLTWAAARELGYEPPADDEAPAQPEATQQAPIAPLTEGETPPLSYAQQRIWFLDQFEPGSPYYNVPSAVRITGRLRITALEQSLDAIRARHEVLRTSFAAVDGVARPVVSPEPHHALAVIDLRGLPQAEREVEAQRRIAEEARRPFDLSTGPLLRATLLRLADEDHIALVTMHHVVSDGWSVGVMIRELAAFYDAFSTGRSAADAGLPPLPIQYGDYAAWQRRWLASGVAQTQLEFWKKQLAGLPPLLELPTDRPRPAVQTLNGARHTFTVSSETAKGVMDLSRKEGVTLFMTLLAAFQTLLHRYAAQEDIAVGTPIAGRNRPEIENLIGFFVNTLVIRSDLSGAPSFRELLHRVHHAATQAYEHQDVPFEMLVEELRPQREMSHTPLFQAMFALQDAPLTTLKLAGASLTPLQPDTRTAKFDLTLNVVERPDGLLRCALEYNTDLFDASTAERMAGHFRALLAAAVANPDEAIGRLPMLTAREKTELFELFGAWNDTAVTLGTDNTLHARLEQQVARAPHATAVIAETPEGKVTSLTFAELDARANQLAHALRAYDVGPEQIVALALERSTDLIVAIFGILKAGAAYLPLDPAYPADRLSYMLTDSGARVLVTQQALLAQAKWQRPDNTTPLAAICLDDGAALARFPIHPPQPLAQPDNLAYIIYTSGSTGWPKGVMVTHRTALNLAGGLHRVAYAHAPHEHPLRLSLNAPLSFDASVQQWIMLTYGHTLVVIPQEVRTDAEALLAFIRRHRLDQLDCVPSQLKLLLAAGLLDPAAEWAPAIAFPGGEAIDPATWQILAQAPATDFYNMYGPTECTVDATTACARLAPGHPTIGRPLPNVSVYVLDRYMQLLPIGVPGELYIGGAGVTRGYLNRPELTAERFVPDPFAGETRTPYGRGDKATGGNVPPLSPSPHLPLAGARLYRTGDLVRWRPDGNLEFLGRTDFQVKVRGFRIELGEIESALRTHPAVRDGVVIARAEPTGDKRLVAYLVAHADAVTPTVADLRQHLLTTLPEHMVPSAFVTLDALPLTPNGKIDRKALPEPTAGTRADLGRAYVPPTTPAEQALAEIWAQVLGVSQVGITDNFFELGGDSILSIQVIARAAQAGLRLTPRMLFQAPTIARLAAQADLAPALAAQAEQGIIEGEVPLTPIQHHFFASHLPAPDHWNQSLLLAVRSQLQPAHLRAAIAALLRHHDALRLRFTRSADGWRQASAGVSDDVPFAYFDLSSVDDAAASATVTAEVTVAQAGLNLVQGPLLRVLYFDLGPQRDGRLFFTIHHLAVDRVSWRIVLEDLGRAYEQIHSGQAPRLPAKTTSFREWALRMVEYADSLAARAEAAYWQGLGRAAIPRLPLDFPLSNVLPAEATARVSAAFLDEPETQALLAQVPQAYGTDVNEVLLTALALAFEDWIGPTLLVEVEGHGRQDELLNDKALGLHNGQPTVDISRTVGWFTAIYPVAATLPPPAPSGQEDVRLGAALKAVKEQVRRAPNKGFGYGILRYLNHDPVIAGQMAALPRPQVSFNYLGQFTDAAGQAGLFAPAAEPIGPDHAPENPRQYVLDVTASVYQGKGTPGGGQLRIEWTYSTALHRPETIDALSKRFMKALRALIAHCLSPEAGGYTPSDFTDVDLNEDALAGLLEELGEIEG